MSKEIEVVVQNSTRIDLP